MVTAHVARRAAAAARRMPIPAALAGVHGAHEHEAARIRHGAGRARDGDAAVLERLAHRLEHGGRKLRQLVEKEHAIVRQTHLARLQRAAAAGHGDVRHRVVRRAKRPGTHDGVIRRREAEDGIDLRGLDHFGAVHRGQNGRQALGEHGLARARRADEQDVALLQLHIVPAAKVNALIMIVNRHGQGHFGGLLPDDIFIQHRPDLLGGGQLIGDVLQGSGLRAVEPLVQNAHAKLHALIADPDPGALDHAVYLIFALATERAVELFVFFRHVYLL